MHSSAAIAAALKSRKQRGQHQDEYMTEMLDTFLEEPAEAAVSRKNKIDEICKGKMSSTTVVLDMVQKRAVRREKQIDGLMEKVEVRMGRATSYSNFLALSVFFILYVIVLFMQNDVASSFAIEASYQNTMIAELPEDGYLSSADDLFDWLQAQVVERAFTEPVCGDGTCEWSPEEYPGFGRFGCIDDCNRYLYTTKITVDLQPLYNASQRMLGWDLKNVNHRGRVPGFTWNIWSDTMGAYLLEEDARAEDGAKVLDVPDGELELRLYQTKSMSDLLDISAITTNRPLGPEIAEGSVPERDESISAFFYGDKREALSAQSEMIAQVMDYCFGSEINVATFDWQCMYPQTDQFLKMFGGYGLNGTVKMGNGSRSTANLVQVPYCSIVQYGIKGLTDPAGNESAKKALVAGASSACTAAGRRRDSAVSVVVADAHAQAAQQQVEGAFTRAAIQQAAAAARVSRGEIDTEDGMSFAFPLAHESSEEAEGQGMARRMLQATPAPTPAPILTGSVGHWTSGGTCREHKHCKQGYITDPFSGLRKWGGGPGQFCYKDGTCATCGDCQNDALDAIDGVCPQDLCPGSGNQPTCLDASALLKDWSCPDTYKFEVRKHFPNSKGAPEVAYPPKVKARYMTPFNRLVGGVLITHSRRATATCAASSNPVVQSFIDNETSCLGEDNDAQPYGWDPVLLSTSSIYDGKVTYASAYRPSEKAPSEFFDAAYGFFNHSYDASSGVLKNQSLIDEDRAEKFLVYLDSRATLSHAGAMVEYMREGGFVDEQTESVEVEFVTFNNNGNYFAHVVFEFAWDTGGSISWDYQMRTVPGPPVYSTSSHPLQMPLEVVCMLLLSMNCVFEANDIIAAIRVLRPMDYFSNAWNYLDLCHFYLMWAGWITWLLYTSSASRFQMKSSYPILADPASDLRFLATDAQQEKDFLDFVASVSASCDTLSSYQSITGVSVLLFLFRLIKNLDFQERMGVVSRTIITAVPDLLHFAFLFFVVYFGFVVVGHIMFGHLFGPLSSLEGASVELFFWLVGYDPGGFWDGMSHAAPGWAFQLYLWSYLIIVFFILFNVLLAILIDTYCEVKGGQDPDAPGFLEELYQISQSFAADIFTSHSKRLPDYKLREILEEHKAGLPSTAVLKQALEDSTAEPEAIILPGGVTIDAASMRALIEHGLVPPADDGDADGGGGEADAGDDDSRWKLDTARSSRSGTSKGDTEVENADEAELLADLVQRYAAESAHEAEKEEDDTIFLLQVEHLKRELSMFRAAQHMHANITEMEQQVTRMAETVLPPDQLQVVSDKGPLAGAIQSKNKIKGLLRVTVVEARNLPAMDLFRSTDAYCLVFLSEPYGESVTGAVTFRTETIHKNLNPVWNADMELPIMPGATALTIAIFDFDSLTSDDMVGVVHVHLAELDIWVQQDKWVPLHNHKMDDSRLAGAELHLKITRLPDVSDPSTIVRAQPSMLDDVSPSRATSVGSVGVVMPGAEAGVAEHDS